MSVLAVGTIGFDTIETPFGRAENILGGSATYIGLAASYMAGPIRLVAVAGNDFTEEDRRILEDRDIDLDGLTIRENGKTFAWEGKYHYDLNQRETLATHLNVLTEFDPQIPAHYRNSRVVCLGNLDPSIQLKVLDQVDNPEIVICDTMNYWIEETPDALAATLERVDILVINDSEARELADHPNLVAAAGTIREMGPDILVIKKGEHGALLFTDDSIFSAPAYPLEDIQDPTGAGDTFAGGFAGYLARRDTESVPDLKRAVIYGSALASFAVEEFGVTRLLNLEWATIATRAKAFRELTTIPEFVAAAQV